MVKKHEQLIVGLIVFGETLPAVRGKKLRKSLLIGLPVFLTGGGARMIYYQRIVRQVNSNVNLSWAQIDQLPMEHPDSLEAPGLKQGDFDRLSVAFGLSFVKLVRIPTQVEWDFRRIVNDDPMMLNAVSGGC
jgi:hypothetical protein